MSLGEIIKIALLDTAIGMGTVFAILIIISLCIWLLGKACYKPAPATEPAGASAAAATATDTNAAVNMAGVDSGELDPQLAAVIALTAIREYLKENENDADYVVRKIRRSTWKHTS